MTCQISPVTKTSVRLVIAARKRVDCGIAVGMVLLLRPIRKRRNLPVVELTFSLRLITTSVTWHKSQYGTTILARNPVGSWTELSSTYLTLVIVTYFNAAAGWRAAERCLGQSMWAIRVSSVVLFIVTLNRDSLWQIMSLLCSTDTNRTQINLHGLFLHDTMAFS